MLKMAAMAKAKPEYNNDSKGSLSIIINDDRIREREPNK